MDIRELPHQLFEEFGQEKWLIHSYVPVQITGHRIAKTEEGFWLSLKRHDEYSTLKLWFTRDQAIEDSGSSCFRLIAGNMEAGTWAMGRGIRMAEKAKISIDQPVDINTRTATIVLRLIQRSLEVGRSEKFEMTEYWSGG